MTKYTQQENFEICYDIKEMLKALTEFHEQKVSNVLISSLGYEKLYEVLSTGHKIVLDENQENFITIKVENMTEFQYAIEQAVKIETVIANMELEDQENDLPVNQDPILCNYKRQYHWILNGMYIEYGEY